MLELVGLGPMLTILILMGIAGVTSYGVTELAKRSIAAWLGHTPQNDSEPWWWNIVVRLGAVLVGAGMGWVLMHGVIGAGLGLAAGVLNTTMVAVVKSRLKGLVPEEEKTDDTTEKKDE